MVNYTIFQMFENSRRGRQAGNFTKNVPKILDLDHLPNRQFPKIDVRCSCLEVLTGKALSFLLEFIDETDVKDFVYKYKLSLLKISLALLYLVDLFINKLKTKFDTLFYRMVLNTKKNSIPFEEISPQQLNICLQKFYLSARKSDGAAFRLVRAKIVVVGK